VDPPGEFVAEDAVDLASVGEGVLARGSLAAGRSGKRDGPVGPVAAADLPRVTILGRRAGHGQIGPVAPASGNVQVVQGPVEGKRPHSETLAEHAQDRGLAVEVPATPPAPSAPDRVEQALAAATAPVPLAGLRRACRIRMATLCAILATLTQAGRIRQTPAGYQLVG
jgi:hypothetical protein